MHLTTSDFKGRDIKSTSQLSPWTYHFRAISLWPAFSYTTILKISTGRILVFKHRVIVDPVFKVCGDGVFQWQS